MIYDFDCISVEPVNYINDSLDTDNIDQSEVYSVRLDDFGWV